MQLILDTESTVDLKSKMSLGEVNLQKCVTDILPDVKEDCISNGDVTNGNTEAAELLEKENVDVGDVTNGNDGAAELLEKDNAVTHKIDQLKESVQTNSVETVDNEAMISKNADIKSNNDIIETSQDYESTDICNGNQESAVNSEPIEQTHNQNNIVESIEMENTSVEKNNTDNESNQVEPESKPEILAENNVSDKIENEDAVIESVVVCNKPELELTTVQSSGTSSADTEAVLDNAVLPCIENVDNSKGCESITEESEETAINNSKKDIENCDINKQVEKNKEVEQNEETTRSDASLAIKEEVHNDIIQTPEINNDVDKKMVMMKTEIEENETMETENTEIDNSDENIDLIRLDIKNELCDKPKDTDAHVSIDKVYVSDPVETENLNTGDVAKMDVDETANNNSEIDTKEINVAPTENNTESTESKDCEFVETDNSKTGSTLNQDHKSSDDGIVNLDDDKENPTVNQEKSESTKIIDDEEKPVINCDDDTDMVDNVQNSISEDPKPSDEIIDLDENVPKEACDSELSSEPSKLQDNKKSSEESKPMEPVLKLSNTLDILSDDEEEQEKVPSNNSKCINIEDDDDVMLIDDDTTANENKSKQIEEPEVLKESKPSSPVSVESAKNTENIEISDKIDLSRDKDSTVPEKEVKEAMPTPEINEKNEEKKPIENQKPLIPENFLKTCKKNLGDMTREELEEFCILKVVESILDRSNLSEIKNKLKVLTQNIEDYKKKALVLSKQNRDLQVVLKSIQDDVKKNCEAPIVPLKITRSVGMQVLMADKPDKRRRGIGPQTPNKQLRTPGMQNPRPQKPTQQIPVPRLVPANNIAIKSPNAQQVNTAKVTSPLPNGIKSVSPVQKSEKRTHNRMQSVTVDLTDDEPPPKVVNRAQNPVPPVRLVPSQNLLAAPRTPAVNSPRKVYIPISGPQGQNVRPGQTIMLKTANPRQRVPPPHMVRMPQSVRLVRPQGLRHPAPLPECMKQYQPPNWKALPPAPDLKLAKVENGIVISWKIEGYQEDSYEEIASYQLYAYQETTSPPNTALWKKIGDVKALPLPMACTLTQFMAGYKYYFAVRAVDIRSRLGPFSLPGSILLLNKM